MEIKFYGQACFSIEDKGTTIVTDPFDEKIGLKMPTLNADVVIVSQNKPAYNNIKAVAGEPRIFSWPGEFETKGIHFRSIHSVASDGADKMEGNLTLIHLNGVKLCHLGNLAGKLNPEQLEQIGDVDVLFVPVGEKNGLMGKKAKEVIEQIEPRVIIPMIYALEGIKMELTPLSAFLSDMNAAATEPLDSFKFKKSELPEDNTKIVVLNVSK